MGFFKRLFTRVFVFTRFFFFTRLFTRFFVVAIMFFNNAAATVAVTIFVNNAVAIVAVIIFSNNAVVIVVAIIFFNNGVVIVVCKHPLSLGGFLSHNLGLSWCRGGYYFFGLWLGPTWPKRLFSVDFLPLF